MGRGVDRFVGVVERIAGGFLALVTALTFVSVVLRYVFAWSIPDSYDLSRNFLGILIFWGIAVTSFRGEHITVELVYNAFPPGGRRVLDVLSTLFALGCMAVFAWAMFGKVVDEQASGETTYDIHLPLWPFYALAWLGIAGAVLMLLIRLARQFRAPPPPEAHTVAISH
ncbi:MAG: TRAP transporter small permease [Acidisphaera sp.]|nr:TRAP transporter small permease [Acidisphaera sp.]MBV9813585.1 TRAP transporter small permease [Acetobacteraceae bacterium]